MVYYGDWQQGADYERSPSYQSRFVSAPMGQYVYNSSGGAPWDDEMNAAIDGASSNTTTQQAPGASLGINETRRYVDGTFDITVEKYQGGGSWSAVDLLDLAYYDSLLQASRPAGATGVEYESGSIYPVAAILHWEFGAEGTDSTAPAGTPKTAYNSPLSIVIRGGQTYGSAAAQLATVDLTPGMTLVSLDLDLTPYMGPSGECAISTTGVKSQPWSYFDANNLGIIYMRSSTGSNSRMIYKLHPPRHRWKYASPPQPTAPPTLPPLRQSPRDDVLGTSSAARICPPPSSRQGGLRRFGGVDC